jgi:hypothetical protein
MRPRILCATPAAALQQDPPPVHTRLASGFALSARSVRRSDEGQRPSNIIRTWHLLTVTQSKQEIAGVQRVQARQYDLEVGRTVPSDIALN